MQLTELKLQEQPGQDAGLGLAAESLWVLLGSVGEQGPTARHLVASSILESSEQHFCGNLNHRLDQELAIIWKCPVHTQPHL